MADVDEVGSSDDRSTDRFDRFIVAQASKYEDVLKELRSARKRTHWMWFVFPQLRGLGESANSDYYGIKSLSDARDYLRHPLLGERLRECVGILEALRGNSATEIFGSQDAVKLRSSLTLFQLAGGGRRFGKCLNRYFDGKPDRRTLEMLRRDAS